MANLRPWRPPKSLGLSSAKRSVGSLARAECERIFVLTYAIPVFKKLGFRIISMDQLPDKIWKDCQGCRKQDHCDETAMIRDLVQVAGQGPGGESPQINLKP